MQTPHTFDFGTRRLTKMNSGSVFLCLPAAWIRHHDLRKGEDVRVLMQNDFLIVLPEQDTTMTDEETPNDTHPSQ